MQVMTRNDKFNTVIGEYFRSSVLFQKNEYPIMWTMKRATRNANKSTQKYYITIPKKVVAFTVDVTYSIEYEPGPVYRDQALCAASHIQTDFNMYFAPFVLYFDAVKKSSVEVLNIVPDEDSLCIQLQVSYYRAHMPYPFGKTNRDYLMRVLDDPSKIEYLEREVAELKRKNQDLEEDTITLTVQMEDLQKENSEEMNKMQIHLEEKDDYYTELLYNYRQAQIATIAKQIARKNRLRNVVFEFYKEKSVLEDCMVCLEKIQPDNLYVSECCHFICHTCAEQCECCPSCRCSY